MTGLVNVTMSYFSGGNVIDGDPSTERVKVPETKKEKSKTFRIKILELMTGLEPVTSALPRQCATDCATSA